MKKIETLVPDILRRVTTGEPFSEDGLRRFGDKVAEVIQHAFQKRVGAETLRMSNLGTKCLRKLWYKVNAPNKGEDVPPEALIKFAYGHILEALLLFLAEEAGHTVEGGQGTLEINGVLGHRDAIIDGTLVDVKSASTYGFKKFAEHGLEQDDPFGYLDQINAYLFASQDDPLLLDKQKVAFLAIDKTLGKIVLDVYDGNDVDYHAKIEEIRETLNRPKPPPRGFSDEPEGKSGNRKLGVSCSYCEFKAECWPGLRMYMYSGGPKFLTKVAKPPRVAEVQEDSDFGF